jgi:hypothetical protein
VFLTTSFQRTARSKARRTRTPNGSEPAAGAPPTPVLSQRVLAWLEVISVGSGVALRVVGVSVVTCAAIGGELNPVHLAELCAQLARGVER